MLLVIVEHDRGVLPEAAREAMTAGRDLAARLDVPLHAAVVATPGADLAADVAVMGAAVVHVVTHEMVTDYGPEAWGESLTQLVRSLDPAVVLTVGSDRGNEVMAQIAGRLDLPFVANCLDMTPGDPWSITRMQWGGSLLEDVTLTSQLPLVSVALHGVVAEPAASPGAGALQSFTPELSPDVARTLVVDRVVLTQGVTLQTAPVVVGGGRGVGSSEGFAALEELAELLQGRVGCSRAVTNNGWRPHADQVGQTGTRIAPEIYIASGISGAVQHWVGAMASKNILAINIDREANMVQRAGYAVIADLHEMVPAISAEIRRRRGA